MLAAFLASTFHLVSLAFHVITQTVPAIVC